MTAWSHSSTTAVVCQLFCNPATSKIIMSACSLFVLLWDFDLFACSTHSLLALDHVWVISATMLDRPHGQAASCSLQEWFIKRISRCGATFQLDFSFISPKSFCTFSSPSTYPCGLLHWFRVPFFTLVQVKAYSTHHNKFQNVLEKLQTHKWYVKKANSMIVVHDSAVQSGTNHWHLLWKQFQKYSLSLN